VHTFKQENRALEWEIEAARKLFQEVRALPDDADASEDLTEKRALEGEQRLL
jgi:hypothetical protein